jgi:peptide/nickel transport system permease protein
MLSYILPLFYPYKYTELSNNTSEPPSLKHPFGTDSEGYDMVSRVLHGTVRSLNIANLTTLLSIGVGVIYALLIVESSKTLSYLMMRVIDVVLTIPLISLAILVVSEVSNGRGDWVIIAAVISSIYWPYVARVTYSNALSIAKQDFVAISRAIGASRRRIMFTHLLPNLINVITVNAVFTYLYAISVEVSLSYIGIGVRPPDVSLGLIVFQNESAAEMRPWLFYIPVIWILILTISAGFIGDGIRKSFQKVNNNNTWLIKK